MDEGAGRAGAHEGIDATELGVEVIERERGLGDVQLVDGEFAREHHRDLGEFDGEGVDIEAVKILRGEVGQAHLAALGLGGVGLKFFVDAGFEAFQLAVGEVEKIAAAAGGIEDVEMLDTVEEIAEAFGGLRAFDLLAPRLHDGGADDLHDIGGVREVRARGVAFVLVEGLLEDGAEDFRLHLRPIAGGTLTEEDDLGAAELDGSGFGEEAAVEIRDAFEPAAAGATGVVHGLEEAVEQIERGGVHALVEETRDEIFFEEPDVFGKEGDEHLEREALREGAGDAALDEFVEAAGELGGGFAGDGDVIVGEDGRGLAGEEKRERAVSGGQIGERDAADGRIHLRFEIVDVKLVEVAEDDVARAAGDEARPVVEGLAVVAREFFPAFLHFDQDDGLPDVVGEAGAAAVLRGLADAKFRRATDIERAGVAERAKEVIDENLRLPLFVAGDVSLRPLDESGEGCSAGIGHAARRASRRNAAEPR